MGENSDVRHLLDFFFLFLFFNVTTQLFTFHLKHNSPTCFLRLFFLIKLIGLNIQTKCVWSVCMRLRQKQNKNEHRTTFKSAHNKCVHISLALWFDFTTSVHPVLIYYEWCIIIVIILPT